MASPILLYLPRHRVRHHQPSRISFLGPGHSRESTREVVRGGAFHFWFAVMIPGPGRTV